MNSAYEVSLVEALDALEAGTPLEEVLSRYPDHAETLRPILETSAQLSSLPVAYSLSAKAASRNAFLSHAASLRVQGKGRPATAGVWRRLAFSFASLALVVVLLGGLLAGAAQEALPGQPLYPVKRMVEDMRLSLASPVGKEKLQEQFQAERREEIHALLATGQKGTVPCAGTIEALSEESWTLDGLAVAIETRTVISGEPALGATAQGLCRVANGRVVAETLQVEDSPEILPEPTPTATEMPTTTLTSTATATAAATAAATTPTITMTPIAQPSATLAPLTAPATEESDEVEESDGQEEEQEDEVETEEEEDADNQDDVADEEETGNDDGDDDGDDDDGDDGDDHGGEDDMDDDDDGSRAEESGDDDED